MSQCPPSPLPASAYAELVELALREDLGSGLVAPQADLSAAWTVPQQAVVRARVIARQAGVIAGLDVARAVFARLDEGIAFAPLVADGARVQADEELIHLRGPARALLTGERTALNFLQQLSGVATLTARFVEAVAGTQARITDTRKTIPGWRLLQKYAVRLGGGLNHRLGLYDAVLIKENHAAACGGVAQAARRARQEAEKSGQLVPIFAEARTLDEVRLLIEALPDRILLDNMAPQTMGRAVALIRAASPHIQIEATGGFNLHNVRQAAQAGVDLISIGALTHSAPALDLSMLFEQA